VAVDGARNAGLLAARILSISRPELALRLARYAQTQETEVLAKARKLEELGPEAYLESKRASP
jgi:5-(carboxyamino)imidazole ribonucleotide mutase